MIPIKSKHEIDLMRKSGAVVGVALEKLREAAKPGVTTKELDRIAEEYIRGCGASPSFKGVPAVVKGAMDFPASICASVNEEVIHGIPGKRELKDGDIISIDIGAYLNGYHGDAARTFAIGNVSDEAKRLIEATERSFYAGIKMAVKGNRVVDISRGVQECAEAAGFSVVRDFVGHGVGKEMHEAPQIPNYVTRLRGPRLDIGMTLAVEPMVNIGTFEVKVLSDNWTVVTADGKLSAHYENTFVITADGPVILTLP